LCLIPELWEKEKGIGRVKEKQKINKIVFAINNRHPVLRNILIYFEMILKGKNKKGSQWLPF
jgi:hypothetical protein